MRNSIVLNKISFERDTRFFLHIIRTKLLFSEEFIFSVVLNKISVKRRSHLFSQLFWTKLAFFIIPDENYYPFLSFRRMNSFFFILNKTFIPSLFEWKLSISTVLDEKFLILFAYLHNFKCLISNSLIVLTHKTFWNLHWCELHQNSHVFLSNLWQNG